MALTNIQVEKAKPGPKDRKLFDEKGLYLLVRSTGHKWRLKYLGPSRSPSQVSDLDLLIGRGVITIVITA